AAGRVAHHKGAENTTRTLSVIVTRTAICLGRFFLPRRSRTWTPSWLAPAGTAPVTLTGVPSRSSTRTFAGALAAGAGAGAVVTPPVSQPARSPSRSSADW